MSKARIAVGVSGGGRSLQNLLAVQEEYAFEVGAVIASRRDCRAYELSVDTGLPVFVDSFASHDDCAFREKLGDWLRENSIDLVALAGFLKPFPVLDAWQGMTINIHPALLPKFGGKGMYGNRVHRAVLEAGERCSGASVHLVTESYDDGAVLAYFDLEVLNSDTVESLSARVFDGECWLYPRVINDLVVGDLKLDGSARRYELPS